MEEKPDSKTTVIGRTKIRWDDSKMRSTYANVCNVVSTREEVMLLFGTSTVWVDAQEEVPVTLSDRILLSPFAAKRLLILLTKGVEEYERNYGSLDRPANAS